MAINLDNVVVGEDLVNNVAVYLGGLDSLVNITDKLNWNIEEYHLFEDMEFKTLTLAEIRDQTKELRKTESGYLVTVFHIEPLGGMIYQLGNYGEDVWAEAGKLKGYA